MEQRVPASHQAARAERKPHLRRRGLGAHGRLHHQVGVQGLQVVVTGLGKSGVRKRRVQLMAVTRAAFAHGALKGAERPLAQAGIAVRRQVAAVDRAEGRDESAAARVAQSTLHRVADGAVAQRGQHAAACYQGFGVDRTAAGADRRNLGAPAQQAGRQRQHAGTERGGAGPEAATARPGQIAGKA